MTIEMFSYNYKPEGLSPLRTPCIIFYLIRTKPLLPNVWYNAAQWYYKKSVTYFCDIDWILLGMENSIVVINIIHRESL